MGTVFWKPPPPLFYLILCWYSASTSSHSLLTPGLLTWSMIFKNLLFHFWLTVYPMNSLSLPFPTRVLCYFYVFIIWIYPILIGKNQEIFHRSTIQQLGACPQTIQPDQNLPSKDWKVMISTIKWNSGLKAVKVTKYSAHQGYTAYTRENKNNDIFIWMTGVTKFCPIWIIHDRPWIVIWTLKIIRGYKRVV